MAISQPQAAPPSSWCTLFSQPAGNAWEGAPRGEHTSGGLWSSGTLVVQAAGDGVLRSTDGGRSWASITIAAGAYIDALAGPGPAHLYAIGTALYRSRDGGDHWRLATDLERLKPFVWPLYSPIGVAPAGDDVYLLGTQHSTPALLHSADAGSTWAEVSLPRDYYSGGQPRLVATSDHELWLSGAAVWHSRDAGATWERAALPRALGYDLFESGRQLFAVRSSCTPDPTCTDPRGWHQELYELGAP